MTQDLSHTDWLLDGRANLLLLREEIWLNPAEMATVDRAIAALDGFLAEPAESAALAVPFDRTGA